MAGKGTRITVDLGNEDLVKALKIAAVESRRTVRDIVVEALEAWLAATSDGGGRPGDAASPREGHTTPTDKDYVIMMETLNRYRGQDKH